MTLTKKFLLLLIIIITIFVLYRLYTQRISLLKEGFREGNEDFDVSSKSEFDGLIAPLPDPPSIGDFNCPPSMTIKDLSIQGSYNTAYTGGEYVSLNMVQYVLQRGCRFLDFEVYNIDGTPKVAVGSQPDMVDTLNSIPLTDIFGVINENAFILKEGDYGVSNPNDPLFIHLRIKNTNTNNFYSDINNIITNSLENMLSVGISKSTLMSDIKKKAIVLIDNNSRGYMDENNSEIITKNGNTSSTNFKLNSNFAILTQCTNPPILDSNTMTNVTDFNIVTADKGTTYWGYSVNPNMDILLDNYGVQVVAHKYYTYDANLQRSEALYGNFSSTITLLANAIRFVRNPDSQPESA